MNQPDTEPACPVLPCPWQPTEDETLGDHLYDAHSARQLAAALTTKVEAFETQAAIANGLLNEITHVKASENDAALAAVLLDLDRCMHGRHSNDECGSCGGRSKGNHHMPVGTVVGYGLRGPIVVPQPTERHNAAAWRRAADGGVR